MAVPTYSGVVNLDAGVSNASIISGVMTGSVFTDYTSGLVIGTLTATVGTYGRGWNLASALNCANGSVFLLRCGRTGSGFTPALTAYPGGLKAALLSSATDYKRFILYSNNSLAPSQVGTATSASMIVAGVSHRETDTAGSLNYANITRFEFHIDGGGGNTAGAPFTSAYFCNTLITTVGDAANPGNFTGLAAYVTSSTPNTSGVTSQEIISPLIKSTTVLGFPCSIQIGNGSTATYWVDKTGVNGYFPRGVTASEFTAGRCDVQVPDYWYIFRIKPSPTDTIDTEIAWSCNNGFQFIVDAFTGTPLVKIKANLNNASPVTLRAGVAFSGNLTGCGELVANGASLKDLTIFKTIGVSSYAPTTAANTSNLLIDGNAISNYGIRLTVNGSYAGLVATLQNNVIADVKIDTGTTGTIDLSGITFPTSGSTTPTNIRYEGTGTATITASRTGLTTSTPNGGTVVLVAPLPPIAITTTPVAARVGIYRISDNFEIMNINSNGTTGLATTTYSGSLPASVLVSGRLAGYQDYSAVQTITTAGLTLAIALPIDRNYNPSY